MRKRLCTLKGKVVSTDEPLNYRGKDGSEKKALHTEREGGLN